MSKRLRVKLTKEEYRAIQRLARRNRMSVSEWIRSALHRALRTEPMTPAEKKLEVVRAAATHAYPTADIDEPLRQIERGAPGV